MGFTFPKNIEEATKICRKILSRQDIKRILDYQNDDDYFWSELKLSGKVIRRELLLILRPKLTNYFEERINTVNKFVVFGVRITNLRNI